MVTAAQQMQRLTAWKRHLLPRTLPQIAGWEWAAYNSENDWPGGDYHDVFPVNQEQWLVFLGDASGNGGAAAVLTGMARMVLHSCPLSADQERGPFCPLRGLTQTPPIILSRLNQILVENSLDEQFMTAFLAQWKPGQARLNYVVAGHPLPRCWRQESRQVETAPGRAGLPLGISPNEAYGLCHLTLEPGDALVMFTDGLVEARDSEGRKFGIARVDELIRDQAPQGAEAIKAGLCTALEAFLHGHAPQDDVTFLVLKRWD
jgi:sigma-B regulation protein RsbU (phosphoserine phosphatase)